MAFDLPPPPVAAASVSAALTTTMVEVSSDYHGQKIVLYGAVFNSTDRPADVVVVVRGPDQPVRIARKVQVAGLWLNSRPVVFQGAPGFYTVASSRPLSEIADYGTLRRMAIGVDHLAFNTPTDGAVETRFGVKDLVVSRLGSDYLDYRRAVVRIKHAAGLYDQNERGVRYVDKGLFRAEIDLPTAAPIGRYQAEIHLFQDGREVQVRHRPLEVRKVGIERTIYLFAHERPWAYGLLAVFLAIASGYGASVIFRRS
ncbi:MAG: hypothetical protein RLZZ141_107 [Pseudomonadota bacterium]